MTYIKYSLLPSFTLNFLTDLMLPGVIIPPGGITAFGRFDKGMLCSVRLKGNRFVLGFWQAGMKLALFGSSPERKAFRDSQSSSQLLSGFSEVDTRNYIGRTSDKRRTSSGR